MGIQPNTLSPISNTNVLFAYANGTKQIPDPSNPIQKDTWAGIADEKGNLIKSVLLMENNQFTSVEGFGVNNTAHQLVANGDNFIYVSSNTYNITTKEGCVRSYNAQAVMNGGFLIAWSVTTTPSNFTDPTSPPQTQSQVYAVFIKPNSAEVKTSPFVIFSGTTATEIKILACAGSSIGQGFNCFLQLMMNDSANGIQPYQLSSDPNSSTTLYMNLISSTLNCPETEYYVTVDNGVVQNADLAEPLPGVKPNVWNFVTVHAEISNFLPVNIERLSTPYNAWYFDMGDDHDYILLPLQISPGDYSSISSLRLSSDLGDLIKNSPNTNIANGTITSLLDSNYGAPIQADFWSANKIVLIVAAVILIVVILLYAAAEYRDSHARNTAVPQFALVLADFSVVGKMYLGIAKWRQSKRQYEPPKGGEDAWRELMSEVERLAKDHLEESKASIAAAKLAAKKKSMKKDGGARESSRGGQSKNQNKSGENLGEAGYEGDRDEGGRIGYRQGRGYRSVSVSPTYTPTGHLSPGRVRSDRSGDVSESERN
ncbi:15742_t:CDS:2, partial [Racocetra fulgida]